MSVRESNLLVHYSGLGFGRKGIIESELFCRSSQPINLSSMARFYRFRYGPQH